MSELNPELATKLKEEGNKFFASKQFSQAYDKYSKALKVGGNNAIIYANRSACCISMGKYLDACSDAKKATELDPAYAKGWGRMGTAQQELGNWHEAVDAYETALVKLPQSGLTSAEKKQKEQYEAGLTLAKKRTNAEKSEVHCVRVMPGVQRPWDRAKAILESAQARGRLEECVFSSVNVINMAANDFEQALQGMRQLQKIRIPNGGMTFMGRIDVLENMSNAILSDRRAFYIDSSDWLKNYNNQVFMQIQNAQAWDEDGPEVVLSEAQQRIRERGWDNARLAISVTVRGWIMRAFLSAGLRQDYAGAVQFYRNAIGVLERGREMWADVPKEDRGAIFEQSFIYGVRAIHLEAYMKAHAATVGRDPRFDAKSLDASATCLLLDVESAHQEAGMFVRQFHGEAFYLAYYVYPSAEACAVKAYALKNMAKGKSKDLSSQLWGESADFYWLAAQKLPEDDEFFCSYIMNSLGSWWMFDDVPLKKTIPLLAQLKKSAPKMKSIWEHSAFALEGRDKMIKKCLDYYEEIQKKIENGSLTENDVYNPPFQI